MFHRLANCSCLRTRAAACLRAPWGLGVCEKLGTTVRGTMSQPTLAPSRPLILGAAPTHPLAREGLFSRVGPFLIPAVLGFAALLGPMETPIRRPGLLIAAVSLGVCLVVALWAVPWTRLQSAWATFPPYAYVSIIFLLRESVFAPPWTFAPLLLLPVFWLAIYASRAQLSCGLLLVGALAILGRWVNYEDAESLRFQFLGFLVMPLVCFTVQHLTQTIREQALQLDRLTRIDPLTGLGNRRYWDEILAREFARSRREGTPLTIAILDLDHFKRLNDAQGHPAGDAVLSGCATAWTPSLRSSDLLVRYGGEEFAVILPACSSEDGFAVVERMRSATPSPLTCSAGVATLGPDETAADLVVRADAALYLAKQAGRDRTLVADSAVIKQTLAIAAILP